MDDARFHRVYHGTTGRAADAIAHTGFDELDGWEIARDVASRFDIAVEALRTSLSAAHPIERTGDPFIWVTTNRIKAMRWANRAPEAELWLLEAAYALLHPEDSTPGMGLAKSLPRRTRRLQWALRNRREQSAAVVVLDVPAGCVADLDTFRPRSYSANGIFGIDYLAQLRLPLPAASQWITEVVSSERVFDAGDVAKQRGVERGEILRMIEAGELRLPVDSPVGDPMWPESELPQVRG